MLVHRDWQTITRWAYHVYRCHFFHIYLSQCNIVVIRTPANVGFPSLSGFHRNGYNFYTFERERDNIWFESSLTLWIFKVLSDTCHFSRRKKSKKKISFFSVFDLNYLLAPFFFCLIKSNFYPGILWQYNALDVISVLNEKSAKNIAANVNTCLLFNSFSLR